MHPKQIALADGVVVWTTVSGHVSSIIATPRHGGAARTLVEDVPAIRALAIHGAFVYFATEDRIGRIPAAGGVPETLVEEAADELAVTDTDLIWLAKDRGLASAPIHGGEPRTLITNRELRGLLVVGDHAYVGAEPQILRVPIGVGDPVPFGGIEVCADAMLEHDTALYAASCHGLLVRAPLDGTTPSVLQAEVGFVTSIAASGDRAVLAFGAQRSLGIVPFAGGAMQTLKLDNGVERIAIDPAEPNVVYVLDEGVASDSGHITRVAI
jgi:hypothetical protein